MSTTNRIYRGNRTLFQRVNKTSFTEVTSIYTTDSGAKITVPGLTDTGGFMLKFLPNVSSSGYSEIIGTDTPGFRLLSATSAQSWLLDAPFTSGSSYTRFFGTMFANSTTFIYVNSNTGEYGYGYDESHMTINTSHSLHLDQDSASNDIYLFNGMTCTDNNYFYWLDIYESDIITRHYVPAIDTDGNPVIVERSTETIVYPTGTWGYVS